MTPGEIGIETSRVSLTRQDIDTLRDWALEKGDVERTVGFAGLGFLMDVAAFTENDATTTVVLTSEEVAAVDVVSEPGKVVSAFRSGMKRIRGARRPKEHQDRDKFTYGSGI